MATTYAENFVLNHNRVNTLTKFDNIVFFGISYVYICITALVKLSGNSHCVQWRRNRGGGAEGATVSRPLLFKVAPQIT